MFYINYVFDLIRYAYGRGILLQLSSSWVLAFSILKDLTYDLWHFAFKYDEEVLVFTIKAFHPDGVSRFPHPVYRLISKTIRKQTTSKNVPWRSPSTTTLQIATYSSSFIMML